MCSFTSPAVLAAASMLSLMEGVTTACLTLELWLLLFSMRTASWLDCSSLSCSLSRAGTVLQYRVAAAWMSELSCDPALLPMIRGMVVKTLMQTPHHADPSI